jgi:hypothetical protein
MNIIDRLVASGDAATREARRRAQLAARGEPSRSGWGGGFALATLAGIAGAAASFLLDPARGRARRARLADQTRAALRTAGQRAERLGRRVRSDVDGRLAAARAARAPSVAPTDDVTIADRVRSELFRDPEIPKEALNINVERGVVVLRGEIPENEIRARIVNEVEYIDGVWGVRDLLHLPDEPAPTEVVGSAS